MKKLLSLVVFMSLIVPPMAFADADSSATTGNLTLLSTSTSHPFMAELATTDDLDSINLLDRRAFNRCIERCRRNYQRQLHLLRIQHQRRMRFCHSLTSFVARTRCLNRAQDTYRRSMLKARIEYRQCIRRCQRLLAIRDRNVSESE